MKKNYVLANSYSPLPTDYSHHICIFKMEIKETLDQMAVNRLHLGDTHENLKS